MKLHNISDLMITDDDASTLHWRDEHCVDSGCLSFFEIGGKASELYPPWNKLKLTFEDTNANG